MIGSKVMGPQSPKKGCPISPVYTLLRTHKKSFFVSLSNFAVNLRFQRKNKRL